MDIHLQLRASDTSKLIVFTIKQLNCKTLNNYLKQQSNPHLAFLPDLWAQANVAAPPFVSEAIHRFPKSHNAGPSGLKNKGRKGNEYGHAQTQVGRFSNH